MHSVGSAEPKSIVVIGTSAGGLNALSEIVCQLKPGIDAAICIVMHLSRTGVSEFLLQRLQRLNSLPCVIPAGRTKLARGTIYIAPPNLHLMVSKGEVIVGHGPQENRWRPSIDVLFRTAAAAYDGRTIGVVLSGLLDDGTAGMLAIKRCGGITIVQDPNEAEYPNMPLSVLNSMDVDESISLGEIGLRINDYSENPRESISEIPEDIKFEAEINEKLIVDINAVRALGQHSVFTCPDCGGGLWEVKNGRLSHYRCYIGHSYTERDLLQKQGESLEGAVWVAIRMMEERRKLLTKLEDSTMQKGFKSMATEHRLKRQELDEYIDRLKGLLFAMQRSVSSEDSAVI